MDGARRHEPRASFVRRAIALAVMDVLKTTVAVARAEDVYPIEPAEVDRVRVEAAAVLPDPHVSPEAMVRRSQVLPNRADAFRGAKR